MRASQAEVLLRIAENTFTDGDDVIAEMRRAGALHARRLLDDKDLLERALEINRQDCARFAQHMPRQTEQDQQEQRRTAVGNQAPPRAVLAQVKKVVE